MPSENKVSLKPLEKAVYSRKWPGSSVGRPGSTEGLGGLRNWGRHPKGGKHSA